MSKDRSGDQGCDCAVGMAHAMMQITNPLFLLYVRHPALPHIHKNNPNKATFMPTSTLI